MTNRNYQEVANEKEILEILGIKNKSSLDRLRQKGLPYVELSRTARVYLVTDVLEWLEKNTVSKSMS